MSRTSRSFVYKPLCTMTMCPNLQFLLFKYLLIVCNIHFPCMKKSRFCTETERTIYRKKESKQRTSTFRALLSTSLRYSEAYFSGAVSRTAGAGRNRNKRYRLQGHCRLRHTAASLSPVALFCSSLYPPSAPAAPAAARTLPTKNTGIATGDKEKTVAATPPVPHCRLPQYRPNQEPP